MRTNSYCVSHDHKTEGSRSRDIKPLKFGSDLSRLPPKDMSGRVSLGVAQSQRVKRAPNPGRRVCPSAISATTIEVDERASCNAECNAPPIRVWSRVSKSLPTGQRTAWYGSSGASCFHSHVANARFGRRRTRLIKNS